MTPISISHDMTAKTTPRPVLLVNGDDGVERMIRRDPKQDLSSGRD
jgi:hypothetical protein